MILKEQKTKIIIIVLLIFMVSAGGLTYAFFSINIEGDAEASSILVETADLSLIYADGNVITATKIFPGWSMSKTFSVENTGSRTEYYDIQLKEVYSTIIKDELVYTLTSNGEVNITTQRVLPNNDASLATKISIAKDVTHTYTLTLTLKEMNYAQYYNQGSSLTAKIQIISPYKYVNEGVQDMTLSERIMLDNTSYPDNASSKYVTSATGINYSKVSDFEAPTYVKVTEPVSFTSNANKYIGTNFTYDNGTFRPTTGGVYSQTYSSDSIGKYTCNNNDSSCYAGEPMYKILEVSGSTVTKVETHYPIPNRMAINGLGLYSTSANTKNNLITHFFRGNVKNNYVSFAGTLWRIVRITEDGNIKLIKDTIDGSSTFNSTSTHQRFVGYMYGSEADPYANTTPSTIKTAVEQSYKNNLTTYESYLADVEMCNDRSTSQTSGDIYYGAYNRLTASIKTPQFKCTESNSSRDAFTLTSNTFGNKMLTKPIGLLSMDEVAYAGGVYGKVSNSYLTLNHYWWTSSPYSFYSSNVRTWIGYPGGFTGYNSVTSPFGVRPVISLKSTVSVLGGSGSEADPYVITTGGTWTNR